ITVVGDDDQSIYSWRGAEVKNILNFPIDFENTKIIKLERNYRSTKSILDLANAVIRNNRIRYEKVLWCENEIGEKPLLRACSSELDEAKRVVDEIERLLEAGVESNKIAVLYRINAQSRTFEEELSRRGILYQIVGGISFYERAEIKDMLAYLRLIVNPKDNVAFMRAVNTPPRGVGRSSLNALAEISTKEGLSLYEASKNASGLRIPSRAKAGLKEFVDLVEQAKEKSNNVYAALKEIVEKSGYIKMLEEEASLESEDRIENIYELLSSAYSFVDAHTERGSVADYLADVSLLTSVDLWDDSLNRVNLMTIHSAKGLEFDYVFLVGLEDGLFPLFSAYEQEHDLEEERRLFYVAITRAKKRLYLSFARSRLLRGQQNYSTPSIFLTEIPKEFVNEEKPSIDSVCDNDFQITINSIVLHPYFGQGRVVEIRGYGKNAIVTVYFKSHGLVKLSLAHTELELL
ncbi:MAG: 3'-5' exonuclease, partial [candidate division WOR-3 bacterium]